MSQEKVDKYKEAKKTRKQDVAREKKQKKLKRLLITVIAAAAACALIVAVVFSIVGSANKEKEAQKQAYQATKLVIPDIAGVQDGEEPVDEAAE